MSILCIVTYEVQFRIKKKKIKRFVPTSRNLQYYIFNLEVTQVVSFLFYTYNYMASYINVILLSPEFN